MLRTVNLQKVYRTYDVETTALNNVNIDVQQGEFIALMGPSGCGKTTLLNVLGLLDSPTGGTYYFSNQDVSSLPERRRARIRKSKIGFIFQSFNLIDELTVWENVELPLHYQDHSAPERNELVGRVLEEMQLTHRSSHFPQQLSGGQQQQVAVARAVVGKPFLILADEPTGNLDSTSGREIMTLLSDLNDKGTTIIMATHSRLNADFCHRVIHLFDGHVVTENIREAIYA